MTPRQLGALVFCSAVWGGSFLFIKVLVDAGVDPAGVGAGRCLFGVLALAPVAWTARSDFPRRPATVVTIALLGAVNMAAAWTLFAFGEQRVTSGVASIVNSSAPLWGAILATMIIRSEELRPAQVAGLLLGFGGVAILVGNDLGDTGSDTFTGTLILLVATVCYGISAVSIRRWLRHVPAVPLTVGQLATALVILAPAALASGAYDGATFGPGEWASLLALGALGSGLAALAYTWLIGQVGAVRALVVTYTLPPIGVFLGWVVLDEPIGWNLLASLACIAAGVALVQRVSFRRVFRRSGALAEAGSAAGK